MRRARRPIIRRDPRESTRRPRVNAATNPSPRRAGARRAASTPTATARRTLYTAFANANDLPRGVDRLERRRPGQPRRAVLRHERQRRLRRRRAVIEDVDGDGVRSARRRRPYVDANGERDARPRRRPGRRVHRHERERAVGRRRSRIWTSNGDGDAERRDDRAVLPGARGTPRSTTSRRRPGRAYVAAYGEPYTDVNGNGAWNGAEPLLFDNNGNGVWDGGYKRGEMWCARSRGRHDARSRDGRRAVRHAAVLRPRRRDNRGLDATQRLYDLEYIPCPMITGASVGGRAAVRARPLRRPPSTSRRTRPAGRSRSPWRRCARARDRRSARTTATPIDRVARGADAHRHRPHDGGTVAGANKPRRTCRARTLLLRRVDHASRSRSATSSRATRVTARTPTRRPVRHSRSRTATTGTSTTSTRAATRRPKWLAFDTARFADGWKGRSQIDTAAVHAVACGPRSTSDEAVYTTLTGFSYFYLSVGGDVGYDSANGFASSIPMNGTPFGSAAASVYEDTIAGTARPASAAARSTSARTTGRRRRSAPAATGGASPGSASSGRTPRTRASGRPGATCGGDRRDGADVPTVGPRERHGGAAAGGDPARQPSMARTAEEGSTSSSTSGLERRDVPPPVRGRPDRQPHRATARNSPRTTTSRCRRPPRSAARSGWRLQRGRRPGRVLVHHRVPASTRRQRSRTSTTTRAGTQGFEPAPSRRAGCVAARRLRRRERHRPDDRVGLGLHLPLLDAHARCTASSPAALAGPGRIKQLPRLQIKSPTIVTESTTPRPSTCSGRASGSDGTGSRTRRRTRSGSPRLEIGPGLRPLLLA